METLFPLNPRLLVAMSSLELLNHYRSLTDNLSPEQHLEVIAHILSRVHDGAIPPSIFSIWLPPILHRFPHLLRSILIDRSYFVRALGLKALDQVLKKTAWKTKGWEAIGGAAGLSEIFQVVGVTQTRRLAKIIGRRMRGKKDATVVEEIDTLVQALLLDPSLLAVSDDQAPKRRIAFEDVVSLLNACSDSFLLKLFSQPIDSTSPIFSSLDSLAEAKPSILRQIAVGASNADEAVRLELLKRCPISLFSSAVPYSIQCMSSSPVSSSATPGLCFCLDLIHSVTNDPSFIEAVPNRTILGWAAESTEKATGKNIPFSDILELLQIALRKVMNRDGGVGWIPDPFPSQLIYYCAVAFNPVIDTYTVLEPKHRRRIARGIPLPSAEHRPDLEALLSCYLSAFPREGIVPGNVCSIVQEVESKEFTTPFPPSAKLRLIKLFCLHAPGIRIDLDACPPCEKDWRLFRWDIDFIHELPIADSIWLFEKIESLSLEKDTVVSPEESAWYHGKILGVKWEAENMALQDEFPMTSKLLEETKQAAEREPDQYQRSNLVKRAFDIAVKSKNIRFLKDVSIWTGRYLRDPYVWNEIYILQWGLKCTPLLSCVEMQSKARPTSLSGLKSLVYEANTLISSQMNTTLKALQEPGFTGSFAADPRIFFTDIVESRIAGIKQYRKVRLGSEDELAEILLGSMIPIILEYETAAVTEGYLAIHWNYTGGALQGLNCPIPTPRYAISFIDRLARKREDIWAAQRRSRHPETAILDAGWPKGLPVQFLFPSEEWAAAAFRHPDAAPYLSKRLRELLFCESKLALTKIPRKTTGIGAFVDDLTFTIDAYCKSSSGSCPSERILEVWNHFSCVLPVNGRHIGLLREHLLSTCDYMTLNVEPRSNRFKHSTRKIKEVRKTIDPPALCLLPNLEDLTEDGPMAWDPQPEDSRSSSDMEMEDEISATIFDSWFSAEQSEYVDFNSEFRGPYIREQDLDTESGCNPLKIWAPNCDVRGLPLPNKEAIIVSALLYLDTFTGESSNILSQQFPKSSRFPRYPSLFLDYGFLSTISDVQDAADTAVRALRQLKNIVPPRIVQKLVTSLLQRLPKLATKSSFWIYQSTTFKLLSLLTEMDQPGMAIDPSLSAVKNFPGMSQWHRRSIPVRLVRNLDHNVVESWLTDFATFVVNSLEGQRDKLQDEEFDGPDECASPAELANPVSGKVRRVKITTVKLLTMRISESGQFTSKTCLRILESLFRVASHMSVRSVVVFALLALVKKSVGLDGIPSAEIYSAITSLYPAVAGPSERVIMSEADWVSVEIGGPLPEVDDLRSLLNVLVWDARNSIPENMHEHYVKSVVLPLLDESTRQHKRWMRLFLNRAGIPTESIPISNFGPFDSDVESTVLNGWVKYLPKEYLLRHRAWSLRYLDICKVSHVKDLLYARDPKWIDTSAGKHWARFIEANKQYRAFGATFQSLVTSEIYSKVQGGITRQDAALEYCKRAAIVLRNPIKLNSRGQPFWSLSPILSAISSLFPNKCSLATAARENHAQFIVSQIARDVDSLRTPSWCSDPHRTPPVLPSRLDLQALLLPLPHLHNSSAEKYDNFTRHVLELMTECLASPSSFGQLETLKKAMRFVAAGDAIHCAVRIGRGECCEYGTPSGTSRVLLSRALLSQAGNADVSRSGEAKAMLEEWANCPDEWTRTCAYELGDACGVLGVGFEQLQSMEF
ncbi:hypothetical protein LOZ57_003942 [Ophidiomyces ophidiicola]|uniref:uncharacterized protein n=1 Tax=Ophidiomyces ophidiicola TaxID=1387563 RepID=UPI0020C25EB8|nr:uncharacterized protein LOZ57_003942 [Ophidiomyces ophidiicola]KAI1946190.1 hypothetical protein LOZ57_003942 [Ophidiomyces ophidiicola]KAI2051009.1 hypothetical protein LOZ43_004837 [Ophidiomyces ophidiicola]